MPAAVINDPGSHRLDLSSVHVHRAVLALEQRGILRQPALRALPVLWDPMFGDGIGPKLR